MQDGGKVKSCISSEEVGLLGDCECCRGCCQRSKLVGGVRSVVAVGEAVMEEGCGMSAMCSQVDVLIAMEGYDRDRLERWVSNGVSVQAVVDQMVKRGEWCECLRREGL